MAAVAPLLPQGVDVLAVGDVAAVDAVVAAALAAVRAGLQALVRLVAAAT